MAGETLLVVDDDAFMRELLTESLSEAGYTVLAAADGRQALDRLNRDEFQIALVDLSLPDMDGMEVVDSLLDGIPNVQIIIMTGYPSIESAIEALRRGAQDYLIKPFKVPEVHAAVDRAVKNQRLEQEVRDLRRRVRELEQEAHQLRGGGVQTPLQPARPTSLPGAYGAPAAYRPPPEQPEGEGEGERS